MTYGDTLRKENKHRKIVLIPIYGCDDQFSVDRTVNTLDPSVGATLQGSEVQHFIDEGFTVTVKSLNSK